MDTGIRRAKVVPGVKWNGSKRECEKEQRNRTKQNEDDPKDFKNVFPKPHILPQISQITQIYS